MLYQVLGSRVTSIVCHEVKSDAFLSFVIPVPILTCVSAVINTSAAYLSAPVDRGVLKVCKGPSEGKASAHTLLYLRSLTLAPIATSVAPPVADPVVAEKLPSLW